MVENKNNMVKITFIDAGGIGNEVIFIPNILYDF